MIPNKTDARIQNNVLDELTWDTRVDPTDVGVEVDNAVVTLTGTVASWAKRVAAEEAAHRVAGVLDVANNIKVKPPGSAERTDGEIAAAVRHALQWDVLVPDDQIQSTVSNGLVTLLGHVRHASERDDAARAVRNLLGVRAVDNRITVDLPQVAPATIRTAIQGALERRADRDAARIQIDVDGGDVTLRGNVHSWAERQAVLGAATGTRGVHRVIDRLHVA
jgi:osmotically-inducible protein OsmY